MSKIAIAVTTIRPIRTDKVLLMILGCCSILATKIQYKYESTKFFLVFSSLNSFFVFYLVFYMFIRTFVAFDDYEVQELHCSQICNSVVAVGMYNLTCRAIRTCVLLV